MGQTKTKKMTVAAMMTAIAYIFLLIGKLLPTGIISFIPGVSFLQYDPKDIVIVIAGFILGPIYSMAISIVVSLIEMITISQTGILGFLMNVISTCCFACTASYIYKKNKKMSGAVTGLIVGVLCMTASMALWNYLVTPFYMTAIPDNTPKEEARILIHEMRQTIAGMLLTAFVPFNLIKAAINMGMTLVLYKPVVNSLRKAGLVESNKKSADAPNVSKPGRGKIYGSWVLGVFIVVTCVLVILVMKGII